MTTTEPEHIGVTLQRRAEALRAARVGMTRTREPTDEERAAEAAALRRERVESARRGNLQRLDRQCPKRFAAATLADVDPQYRGALTDWANDPRGRNLLLAGNVGPGKSHAAVATLRYLLGIAEDFTDVQVVAVVDLLDMLRPGWVPPPDPDYIDSWASRPDPMRRACTVDVLLLDDIGTHKDSEWVSERLSAIIDARWREELPTIATTNLKLGRNEELETVVGERAYSRLVGSDAVVIRMAGQDRRRGGVSPG